MIRWSRSSRAHVSADQPVSPSMTRVSTRPCPCERGSTLGTDVPELVGWTRSHVSADQPSCCRPSVARTRPVPIGARIDLWYAVEALASIPRDRVIADRPVGQCAEFYASNPCPCERGSIALPSIAPTTPFPVPMRARITQARVALGYRYYLYLSRAHARGSPPFEDHGLSSSRPVPCADEPVHWSTSTSF